MRSAATIVVLLLLACTGTRAKDDAEPVATDEVATEPAPPDGFVVLRAGTPLFRRPADTAPSVVLDLRRAATYDQFRSFEVVGNEGHWIRIRNVRDSSKHCTRGWQSLLHFEIDFWVRESDLQRVTRRSVLRELGDGTSIMLAAGTPVAPDHAGQWTALGLGASARVPLPVDAVGTFYRPGNVFEPGRMLDKLPPDARLDLGGNAIDTRPLMRIFGIPVYGQVRRDDGTLVTVGTRCAELRVLARGDTMPIDDVDAEIAARTGALEDLYDDGRRYSFEAGAEVFWRDGEPAGKLVEAHTFRTPPSVDSDRRCFAHAGLTVCLRADAMKTTLTNGEGW